MNPSVKVGQVQTDAGLIPMDWNITRIDAHCSIKTGSRNTQDKVEGGAYPFYVRSQQVERINSYSYDGEAVLTAGDGVGTGKVFHYINENLTSTSASTASLISQTTCMAGIFSISSVPAFTNELCR